MIPAIIHHLIPNEGAHMSWVVYALVSAAAAGLTAILAKLGVEGVPSTLATAIRTVVVTGFAWAMVFGLGEQRAVSSLSRRSLVFLALSGWRPACRGSRTSGRCRWRRRRSSRRSTSSVCRSRSCSRECCWVSQSAGRSRRRGVDDDRGAADDALDAPVARRPRVTMTPAGRSRAAAVHFRAMISRVFWTT